LPGEYESVTAGALRLEKDGYEVTDLLNKTTYRWHGSWNYVRLDPHVTPAHVFCLSRG